MWSLITSGFGKSIESSVADIAQDIVDKTQNQEVSEDVKYAEEVLAALAPQAVNAPKEEFKRTI